MKQRIMIFLLLFISMPSLVAAAEQDQEKIEVGKKIFEDYSCHACHGKEGKGGVRNPGAIGGEVPKLTYVAESFVEKELKKKILEGVPVVEKEGPDKPDPPLVMPTWKGVLSEEQIDAVAVYLFSLMPEEERDYW